MQDNSFYNSENQGFSEINREKESSPEQILKGKIKKSGVVIGLMLLFFTLFKLVFEYFIGVFGAFFAAISGNNSFLYEPAVETIVQIVFSLTLFTIPFVSVAKLANTRISDLVSFEKPKRGVTLPLILAGVSVCAFSNIASSYLGEFFSGIGFNYQVDFGEDPKGIFGFILAFISTAIAPALVEEFAFRGIVLGHLKKYSETFAVIVSGLAFGIIHGNFIQMPFASLVGMILGFISVKTGSIWPAVAVHFINNATSVVFSFIPADISMEMQNVIYVFYLIISLMIGIIALVLLRNRDDAFALNTNSEGVKEKSLSLWFFTSPLIIIFICIYFYSAFKFFIF